MREHPISLQDNIPLSQKIARKMVTFVGARRALLMQVAHPLVAQGAKHHSNFQKEPYKRLFYTVDYAMTMVYGTEHEKERWITIINKMHAKVRGIADDPELPRNTIYSARNPKLLLWVQTTLVDTAITAYEHFVEPLTKKEKDSVVKEMMSYAPRIGIPERMAHRSYSELEDYMQTMLWNREVRVTQATRELVDIILHPYPLIPHALYGPLNFNALTAGLLPPEIRNGYGLRFGLKEKLYFDIVSFATRKMGSLVPKIFQTNPYAYETFRVLKREFGY